MSTNEETLIEKQAQELFEKYTFFELKSFYNVVKFSTGGQVITNSDEMDILNAALNLHRINIKKKLNEQRPT